MVQSKATTKKTAVPKDFERRKVKVGRPKAGAVNKTNTSFQSKRLNLKGQDFSVQDKILSAARSLTVPTTSLAALLKPTLPLTGHYNVNTRKEAFAKMIKTCRGHPLAEVVQILGEVMERVAKGMIDEEPQIRNTILGACRWMFETLSDEELSAFMDVWFQFLLLALTHIDGGVRADSYRFLECLLTSRPRLLRPQIGKIFSTICVGTPAGQPLPTGPKSRSRQSQLDLIMAIIESVLAPVPNESGSKGGKGECSYFWRPQQTVSLAHALVRRQPGLAEAALLQMSVEEAHALVRWVGQGLLNDWLEAAPLLHKASLPSHLAKGPEREAYTHLKVVLGQLGQFLLLVGQDPRIMLDALPNVMRTHEMVVESLPI